MNIPNLNLISGALIAVMVLPVAVAAETVAVVNFASARHELNAQARATLNEFAKKNGRFCVNLAGHTDSRGSLAYNQARSERRVQSVAAYLKTLKFKRDITGIKAFGEETLAVNKEGDVLANRRVELRPYKCGAGALLPPGGAAPVLPAWLVGIPLVCLSGACDFSSTSTTTTTTTTTTSTPGT